MKELFVWRDLFDDGWGDSMRAVVASSPNAARTKALKWIRANYTETQLAQAVDHVMNTAPKHQPGGIAFMRYAE